MENYRLIRSKRKTLSLEISDSLELVVRAPLRMSSREIDSAVLKYSDWTEKHRQIKRERMKYSKILNVKDEEVAGLRVLATKIIPPKVEFFAKIMGVKPTGIKITSAKKRFGSCSAKKSLCFSLYLCVYPEAAIDYVVVHELAHIKHMNHSRLFYDEVANVMPDFREREKLLK